MRRKQVAMVVRPQKGNASPEGRRNMAEGCLSRHCREFSNPCKIYETTKNTGKTQKGNPHQKSTNRIQRQKYFLFYVPEGFLSGQASRPFLLAPLCRRQLQTLKKIKDKQRGTRKWRMLVGLHTAGHPHQEQVQCLRTPSTTGKTGN